MPNMLLSGHQGEIARWRHESALAKTRANQPDFPSTPGIDRVGETNQAIKRN